MDAQRVALLISLFLFAPLLQAWAQTGDIYGTVTDAETQETLPGVNVVIDGTTQGVSTDAQGEYMLSELEPGSYTLVVTFVGYAAAREEDIQVEAGEAVEVNFALEPGVIGLDELVTIGYGEVRRRDLTGSIGRVSGDDVSRVASVSADQALQGRLAGVQVVPSSGEPGAGAIVRIRGVGTLNDSSPLYVVDGMLLDDISFLNAQDIASVEVLKDASATAIYGSRGANGVIIISTKRGQVDQPTSVQANAYYGWENAMNQVELTNAREYAMLANELAANQGLDQVFDNPDAFGEGTNWQDEVFRTAPMHNLQVSASGGVERMSYFVSGNYTRQGGIIPKSEYERLSLRINNDYHVSDFITLGHNLSMMYREGRGAPGVTRAAFHADPTLGPRDEEGNFRDLSVRSSVGNPAATIFYTQNENSSTRLVGDLYADIGFLEHFTLRSSIGMDYSRSDGRSFSPQFFVSPTQQSEQTGLSVNTGKESNWLWENTLTFQYGFGDHRFDLLGGITAQEYLNESLGGSRQNIIGEGQELWYLNAGETDGMTNFHSGSSWSMLSYLFRANYYLMDRYMVTGSFRVDGSSRFGPENRYSYFPSIAVGWLISDEGFLSGYDDLSHLKLRGSWGKIGNDKIGAYPGRPLVSSNLNAVFGSSLQFGQSLVDLANPDVRWEETSQFDVGLDVGFFDDRLFAELDYYTRITDGILIQVPIPNYVGVGSEPFVNAASVLNRGFELSLDYAGRLGALDYSVGVQGSTINNEVLELGRGQEEIFGGGLPNEISFTTKTVVGQPIGAFHGYRVDGIFQNEQEIEAGPTRGGEEPGDVRYLDVNGDGQITSDDRTFLGSPIPDYVFGLNIRLDYRGIDLTADFSGQQGNLLFNANRTIRFGIDNFERSYLDRWHGEGTSNSEPRITNAGHNYLPSERFLEEGSFFKLQNLQLGYTLPASVSENLRMESLRLYINGTNVYTFTGYSGFTPEVANSSVLANGIDLNRYPVARTVTLGVNMTF